MKKISIVLLILALTLNSSIVSGQGESKLHNYWPYNIIEESIQSATIQQNKKEVLSKVNNISFKLLDVIESYDSQEGIVVTNGEDKVLVRITKMFSTPGHSMDITNIRKTDKGYRIKFHIRDPNPEEIHIQAITYQTLSLEIPKKELDNTPYIFILDGYNKIPEKITI